MTATHASVIEYLTPDELHLRWKGQVSVKTLANWRVKGFGPKFTRVGARILYSTAAVEAFERQSEMETTRK